MNQDHCAVSEKLRQDIEDSAAAIQRCKAIGQAMAENTEALRLLLEEFDQTLVALPHKMALNRAQLTEFGRLRSRIQRLGELRNMQELCSFQIQIERTMAQAWEALP